MSLSVILALQMNIIYTDVYNTIQKPDGVKIRDITMSGFSYFILFAIYFKHGYCSFSVNFVSWRMLPDTLCLKKHTSVLLFK